MQILNLNITEYASIKDRSIDLEAGLNIIEGENESGKSTLLSFIKFVLYGLPKRERGESVTEKDRSFSWSGGLASGSMTVRTKDGDFRIERTAREGTRSEKLTIVELASGTAVHKGEIPGELFLGVPLSVFESSACIKQLGCTSLNGSELGNALENLLISADENLDTEKASEKIDSLRKKLLHKSGRGGSIYELNVKKEALKSRLEGAKQKSAQIMDYEASFEELSDKCGEYRAKLEESRILLDAYERRGQIIRFDSIHSLRARISSIEAEEAEIKAERCIEGYVPTAAYRSELAIAHRERLSALENAKMRADAFRKAESALPKEEGENNGNEIEDAGGASDIASRFSDAKKGAKAQKGAGVTALVTMIISAILAILSAFLYFDLPIPLLAGISSVLPVLANRSVMLLLFIITAILLISAIISFGRSKKSRLYARELSDEFSFGFDESEEDIKTALSARVSVALERERLLSELEVAKKEYELAARALEEAEAALKELLARTVALPLEDISADELSDIGEKAIADAETLSQLIEEKERDLAKYKGVLEERLKEVEGLDEAELRASVSPEVLEKLQSLNITMLRREYDFLKAKADSAEQKKYFYDRELIGLRATAENPLKAEALLSDIESRIESEALLHDALDMAMTVLAEASESMRKSVTPRLRSRAGEILSTLTGGKYSELGISADFTITVTAGGVTRPIEVLSAGTRDAAYLAVRLALIEVLFRIEMPPLLFDEVLSQIDDKRAEAVLSMLRDYCEEGVQCLLFSCHTRESAMTKANVIRL